MLKTYTIITIAIGLFVSSVGWSDTFTVYAVAKEVKVVERQLDVLVDEYAELYEVKVGKTKIANLSEERIKNAKIVWDAAKKEEIDAVQFVRLAFCESSLDGDAVNQNTDKRKTTDYGLFQINDYWHAEVERECALSESCSAKWSAKRIKNGYIHEWYCSKKI
jgi:hypothetical protein